MPKHTDLRVRYTRSILRDALIDLINEKGFDAVTVGDIAERAMVNRATFYRHYQDKYALVESIFQETVDTMLNEFGPPAEDIETFIKLDSAFESGWTKLFEHFARYDRLYRAMLGSRGSNWFKAHMINSIAELYKKRESPLILQLMASKKMDIPPEVISSWFAGWLVSVLTWWLENDMKYSPQQMASWNRQLMAQGLHSTLGISDALSGNL
ncbi:TetR/AcrR family transcriptional regulator [Desulfosporosinus sp. PR]|uniref:TetR/AcrR family transcriptional regulator n=1 Tax=Candidatus Desulfosporosinus nitrosoreducens TaxID=3401928 RepID=UPI0027FFA097|nr:TetR/AcrR family transcriptional regulator [Desulfosporosinus sp. PR]MDQ7094333.1 TetR/AcrR family transcriptional regulator [Desulfosporosinus sp. PR]